MQDMNWLQPAAVVLAVAVGVAVVTARLAAPVAVAVAVTAVVPAVAVRVTVAAVGVDSFGQGPVWRGRQGGRNAFLAAWDGEGSDYWHPAGA